MSELQFSILWSLLTLGGKECNLVDSKILVNGFPDDFSEKAKAGLKNIIEQDYVIRGIPTDDKILEDSTIDWVGINPKRYEEVKRMVHPDAVESIDIFAGKKLKDEIKQKLNKYKTERLKSNE